MVFHSFITFHVNTPILKDLRSSPCHFTWPPKTVCSWGSFSSKDCGMGPEFAWQTTEIEAALCSGKFKQQERTVGGISRDHNHPNQNRLSNSARSRPPNHVVKSVGPFKIRIFLWLKTWTTVLQDNSQADRFVPMNLNLGGIWSVFSMIHVSYGLNHLATVENQRVICHLVMYYILIYLLYTV